MVKAVSDPHDLYSSFMSPYKRIYFTYKSLHAEELRARNWVDFLVSNICHLVQILSVQKILLNLKIPRLCLDRKKLLVFRSHDEDIWRCVSFFSVYESCGASTQDVWKKYILFGIVKVISYIWNQNFVTESCLWIVMKVFGFREVCCNKNQWLVGEFYWRLKRFSVLESMFGWRICFEITTFLLLLHKHSLGVRVARQRQDSQKGQRHMIRSRDSSH